MSSSFLSSLRVVSAAAVVAVVVLVSLPWQALGHYHHHHNGKHHGYHPHGTQHYEDIPHGGDASTSRLNFQIPRSLFRFGGYPHQPAAFGMPPYGGVIANRLYYSSRDICHENIQQEDQEDQDAAGGKDGVFEPPFILMVDRAVGCSFVYQVKAAQDAGAAAVIIANTHCECSDHECMNQTKKTDVCVNEGAITMEDHAGTGWMVSIPSFMMSRQDANLIKTAILKDNQNVLAEMEWSVHTVQRRVEYELWTLPYNAHGDRTVRDLKDPMRTLSGVSSFTPRMKIKDGNRMGCQQDSRHDDDCVDGCSNGGRYCAMSNDPFLSGRDIVEESLRRICVWNIYGRYVDGFGLPWWEYVYHHSTTCDRSNHNDECVEQAFASAGIDSHRVKQCMSDSGGLDTFGVNVLLEGELEAMKSDGVVTLPSLIVNHGVIEGSLGKDEFVSAICSGFDLDSMPAECTRCSFQVGAADCMVSGLLLHEGGQGGGSGPKQRLHQQGGAVSMPTFVISVWFLMAAFVVVGVWHYRKSKREMHDQVQDILAEYMPLPGGEEEEEQQQQQQRREEPQDQELARSGLMSLE